MKILFLDESGDHNLIKIDAQYPVFVLAGVIMDASYHDTLATSIMNQTKMQLFGRTDIVFHTADIARNRNGFEQMIDPKFRKKFYDALNNMMSEIDYKIVAVAIDKVKHKQRYGIMAVDPYLLSLEFIVERFVLDIMSSSESGRIIAECRSSILDNQLELSFLNTKIQGTRFIRGAEIKKRITSLSCISKDANLTGLQIADLIASPIGRYVIGRTLKEDFRVIQRKFRMASDGNILGFGLKVFP